MRHIWVYLLCATSAFPQVVTTFAGTDWIFPGDGKPALQAPFGQLTGVTVGPDGNPIVFDRENCIAARIDGATVRVLAGNGLCIALPAGENGPATSAIVALPSAITTDAAGNLFLLTRAAVYTVRGGVLTRIAGDGAIVGFSGDNGPGPRALIDADAGGVAVDASGAFYFADTFNHRVRKVDPNGVITTIAGSGAQGNSGDGGPPLQARFSRPRGLAFDPAGNLYVLDAGNFTIRRITPGGAVSTLTDAYSANWIAAGRNGALYFNSGSVIQKWENGAVQTIGGTGFTGTSGDGGPALEARFTVSLGGAVDAAGNVYIADNFRLRRISTDGVVRTIAGSSAFRYSGEGVPAPAAVLNRPLGIAATASGIVYIAENAGHRIRKVEGGVITTFAGTGSPDRLPAAFTQAPAATVPVATPTRLALDPAQNLYALSSDRVLRITPAGILTVYADLPNPCVPGAGLAFDSKGNLYVSGGLASVCKIDTARTGSIFMGTGALGYSGDGGPPLAATLRNPGGVAVDPQDNVYVADRGNDRIRMVTTGGTVRTVAGIGTPGFTGDRGPAVTAAINQPAGLAFDAAGNLYFADANNHRIRQISPDGVINTVAGKGFATAIADGKLALDSILQIPEEVALDSAGNLYIAEYFYGRVRQVLAATPAVQAAPLSISLSGSSGGPPVASSLTVTGSISGLEFDALIGSAPWLTVEAARASTPRQLALVADPANLAPGSYSATLTVAPAAATPAAIAVNVSFNVGPARPAELRVDKEALSFTLPRGATTRDSTLIVSNAGGGQVNFTASAATSSGGAWLSVFPVSAQVSPARSASVVVSANPSGLAPGTYTGSIRLASASAPTVTVPVNMTVSSISQALLLTQSGLSFTAVVQGGLTPPQSFGIVNPGSGSVNWTAASSTLSGGPSWLVVTPARGVTTAGAPAPQVTVNVAPAGLAAGAYYGLVRIEAPGAANTPQVVTVFLEVLPAGSDPGAEIVPAELTFTTSHTVRPGSQQLSVYSVGAQSKTYRTSITRIDTLVAPAGGSLDPGSPFRITVQPLVTFSATAAPSAIQDSLTFQFSDGRVKSARINFISTPSPAPGAARSASGCAPTRLVPSLTNLGGSFAISAGWPVGLVVEVRDDCGDPQTSGNVIVSFSNGDPILPLRTLNDGSWQGTWQTRSTLSDVTLRIDAIDSTRQLRGTREIAGGPRSTQLPPVISAASIGSAADFVKYSPLAPGGMISIYGERLANATQEGTIPLPTRLSDTEVFIGGFLAPLFYASPTQINALVPNELTPNTTHQLFLRNGLTYSQPAAIDVGPAQPAAFLSAGSAIAYAYRGTAPPFLVTGAAPARSGDVLLLYTVGLGPTTPPVRSGEASPGAPVAQTQNPIQVSIGGVDAPVAFAGLAPGFVGLFQVNLTVPAGVPTGEAVPIVITSEGQTSPPAAITIE